MPLIQVSLIEKVFTPQLLNPPLRGYLIDIMRKSLSVRRKTKDVASQANITHDFGAAIKCGKAIGLLGFSRCRCYGTPITCVS
jgi:hypothetical protein